MGEEGDDPFLCIDELEEGFDKCDSQCDRCRRAEEHMLTDDDPPPGGIV